MADDDDAQGPAGPEEILSPSGPRRSSYTPPSNDEESREAAASVFNDDAIAAAMAAELAKVASGPIQTIPDQSLSSAPSAPDAPEAGFAVPMGAVYAVDAVDVPAFPEASTSVEQPDVAPVVAPVSFDAVAPASLDEAASGPEESAPEESAPDGPAPEGPASEAFEAPSAPVAPEAMASTDELPPPYIGAPAPTVPPAYAPPPPGYESSQTYFADEPPTAASDSWSTSTPQDSPTAEPVESQPTAVVAPSERLRPRRQPLADEDLLRSLNDNNLSPEATLDVISRLQAQLELREREAREYTAWESSRLAEGTPEALAEVQQARAEFVDSAPAIPATPSSAAPSSAAPSSEAPTYAAPTDQAPANEAPTYAAPTEQAGHDQPADDTVAPSVEALASWTFEAEPSVADHPMPEADAAPASSEPISSFAPESSVTPEAPVLPASPPAPEPEPSVDAEWAARWAPQSDALSSVQEPEVQEPEVQEPEVQEPEVQEPEVPESNGAESSEDAPETAPETAASSLPPVGWNDDPIFRFVPSAPTESAPPEPAASELGDPGPAVPEAVSSETATDIPYPGAATAYEPPAAIQDYADFGAPFSQPEPAPAPQEQQTVEEQDGVFDVSEPVAPTMSAWEQALAETSGGVAHLPEAAVAEVPADVPAPVEPLDSVDGEPSLEGTAFADLLASAPPPVAPVQEQSADQGSAEAPSSSFGLVPESGFTGFEHAGTSEADDPGASPFDSLFDPPAPGAPSDSFAPPAFLPPPSFASPPFDAPPPTATSPSPAQTDAPAAAPDAPSSEIPPRPAFTPPALIEPPAPTEVPPEFSSQIGVVPTFDAPPPPTGAVPQPVALPEPPAPFTRPSDTVQPAPFAVDVPLEQSPVPAANFESLLTGGGATIPDASESSPAAAPPDGDEPPPADPPSGGPVPFGEGVVRGNATDPIPSALPGSLGPVAVTTTGIATVAETVAMEAPVVSAPIEIPPPAPVAMRLPIVARSPRLFSVESSSLEPTPVEQRVGRAARLFWLWFAANSSLVAVAFGGLIFTLGTSLRQAIIAIFVGVAVSILPLALTTLAGKRSGQPTMVVSRASFGVIGNIVPAVVALVSRVFWGAALLWIFGSGSASVLILAKVNDGFNGGQLTFMLIVFGFLICVALAYFGYALIARIQLFITVISAVLVVGFIALTVGSISLTTALTTGDGSWMLVLTGAVLAFSFVGIVWANSGSDLARYQRPGSSGASSMAWASFGTALPSLVLIGYGAVLAASHPDLAQALDTDPMLAIGSLLPSWYPLPLLVATGLSLLSGVTIAVYSGGFALVTIGVRVRRPIGVVIAGAAVLASAMVLTGAGTDFVALFRDVATTVAVPVAAWIGIFATETMVRRRPFDSDSLVRRGGIYADVRWPNLLAFVVISVIGFGLIGAHIAGLRWEGFLFPLAGQSTSGELAQTDVGVVVALVLGLLFPLVAGVPAIRRQEIRRDIAE